MPFILYHLAMKLEGLRQQLQEAENRLNKGQRDLIEAHRGLQDCAEKQDKLRKEALDLRRAIGEETREKEAIQVSNHELRVFTKRAEGENSRYSSSCHTRL